MLLIFDTHPIQYRAPLYRKVSSLLNARMLVIYKEQKGIEESLDEEFNTRFAWDTDLLSGYKSMFLSKTHSGVRKILNIENPKAVVMNGYADPLSWKVFFWAKIKNIPILFYGDTTDHAKKRGFLKKRLRFFILKTLYKNCTAIIYIGKRSLAHYNYHGVPKKKLFFSPHSVDNMGPGKRDKKRKAMNIRENEICILYSGKLSERKNPCLILKAVTAPELRDVKLCIAFMGSGKLLRKLQEIANTISYSNIKVLFLGFQNQSQISDFYAAADILILPSKEGETWGLVVNEALAHGTPCVISDQVGCAPDLITPGKNGEIFYSDIPASLTKAILRCKKLLSRSNLFSNCIHPLKTYSIDNAAQGFLCAYNTILLETNK